MTNELQQRNENFRAFLDTLNPAQRRAVEKTEGPVLVIAGPGTGKTHILTTRIGQILLETDARPQNILCLTFTDAAATNMRKRLLDRIGPEAHRVPIFTFHGFCHRIIQESMEYFSGGMLEPLSDLERIEVVRELLQKEPVTHPLRAGKKDVFQYEAQLRDLFANMKKEGWTPGFVRKTSDAFLNNLPQNPDFIYQRNTKFAPKGAPKQAQIANMTDRLQLLKAGADLFPKYQHALERIGRYEFEDMLLWVNRAFEKNESLLRSYQERYQYILVDEFQDTNGAQFQLLVQLLDFWTSPNVFIVGDDDQSIFEFQGARLENLIRFSNLYRQGLEIIVLEENYRSTQPILDAAGALVGNNALRAVDKLEPPLQKQLRAHTPAGEAPLLLQFGSRFEELTEIRVQIENLLQNGTAPQEIAVLYSRHRQANRLQKLLSKKGIPFQTKRPWNILEAPAIQHFRSLLHYLYEESIQPFSGEHRLFRLLHAGFFDLPPLDLALVAVKGQGTGENRSARYGDAANRHQAQVFLWRKALCDREWLGDIPLEAKERLLQTGAALNQWITDALNMPLPALIEHLYRQTGLLDWSLRQDDKVLHLHILNSFLDAVPAPENTRPSIPTRAGAELERFLQMLDNMESNGLPLPLNRQPDLASGIQLLSAHAAKGLEFEHVFILDCVEDAWEKSSGDRRKKFTLPDTLTLSGEEDALEARRRLFYVAMTRAKRGLTLSFSQMDSSGKPLKESRFLHETGLKVQKIEPEPQQLLETQTLLLGEAAAPTITLPEKELIDELLSRFSLSITSLNRYLRCPLAFWYEDLLRVPYTLSEAAAYGTAMHGALQRFFLKMKTDKQFQWPSAQALDKMFLAEMERMRGHFSENSWTQRLTLGRANLQRIYVEQIPFWKKRAVVERRIDRVDFDGIPINGALDKIEWLDNGKLRLVDFKTGTPDPKKTAPPSDQQPNGGEYWRQLAFYQILLESAGIYPESVEKTAISWLEADKKGFFPTAEITFSREDLNFCAALIRSTYTQIQERRFDTGCGKEDCIWCTMLRNVAPGMQEEDLDDA